MHGKFEREVEELEPQYTPEKVWEAVQERAKAFYDSNINWRFYDEQEKEEELEKRLREEEFFVKEMISKLAEVFDSATENGKERVFILFDLDDTLVKRILTDEPTTVVRPSAIAIMQAVRGMSELAHLNAEIGTLTNRSSEAVSKQLDNPAELGSLNEYMSRERLYSDRGQYIPYFATDEEMIAYTRETWADVVDTEYLESNIDAFDRSQNNFTKLTLLASIRRDNPNAEILAIDDFHYPQWVDSRKGVHGLSLRKKGMFFV